MRNTISRRIPSRRPQIRAAEPWLQSGTMPALASPGCLRSLRYRYPGGDTLHALDQLLAGLQVGGRLKLCLKLAELIDPTLTAVKIALSRCESHTTSSEVEIQLYPLRLDPSSHSRPEHRPRPNAPSSSDQGAYHPRGLGTVCRWNRLSTSPPPSTTPLCLHPTSRISPILHRVPPSPAGHTCRARALDAGVCPR